MPKKSRKSETVCVKITTSESQLEFNLPKDAPGQQLFEQVARTVGLREVWYFGMKYLDKSNKSVWLRTDKKISSIKFSPDAKNEFTLRVKFFPEDVEKELIQAVTIRHFYLQVKNDILSGTIKCPTEKCLLLAAYACVAKFGPYTTKSCPAKLPIDRLIQDREILNLSDEDYFQRIISSYKELGDMLREDAMVNYLKMAQGLETYGFESFQIQDKSGASSKLRVDAFGIKISSAKHTHEPEAVLSWSEIKNLTFHDKKFVINPVDPSTKEVNFLVEKTRLGKEIRSLCIGNHDLYMRRRKPDSIEVQQMKLQASEERELKDEERRLLKEERRQRVEFEKKLEEIKHVLAQKEEECFTMSNKVIHLESKLKVDSAVRGRQKANSSHNHETSTKEESARNDKINSRTNDSEQSDRKKSGSSKKETRKRISGNGSTNCEPKSSNAPMTNGYANDINTKSKISH